MTASEITRNDPSSGDSRAETVELNSDDSLRTPVLVDSLARRGRSTEVHSELQRREIRGRLFGEPELFNERFQILARLGEGGTSVVYLAYDQNSQRKVALKVLRVDGPEFTERLKREARSMQKLAHPNVVTLHEVEDFGGQLCLVMDYIQGQTLAQWLESPRSLSELARVFLAAGQGIAAAHARGIVHRDFKPQNVLVADDGAVKVTDFGLAKRFEMVEAAELSDSGSGLELGFCTAPGTVLGTPRYMSPEQFNAMPCDARADQFSFCVTLFEALFGQHPFGAITKSSVEGLVLQGQIREPEGKRELPGDLVEAIRRGLSVLPERRHESMQPLWDLLEAMTAGN
jgi:serine/threonine protein kinase